MLTKTQNNTIHSFFKNEPVDAVYLFGSQAEGTATNHSDYDIAVIFQKKVTPSERFDARLRYISILDAIFGEQKSEVVDFEALPTMYKYHVIAPRKMIYNNNHNRVVDLEIDAVRHYLDMKPYHQYMNQRQLAITAEKGILP
jgi:predicted nucleotidyltransferase